MKKMMSVLLVSGITLGMATPALATDLGTADGVTSLEITDFTVDPDTKLPTDPGSFTLDTVPNIDFGQHSLDSIADANATFTGTYTGDLQVTDTRPMQTAIDSAEAQIATVTPSDKVTQEEIDASKAKWDQAIAASAWRVDAMATDLDGVGTSLKIGATEVLNNGATIVSEAATEPVGTKSYTSNLAAPVLTIANNNLSVKKYEGTITYTAVNAL